MRALVYESFGGELVVRDVPAPVAPPGGVVVDVGATGVCRSDWHGWQGHDPDVRLPHVPGHELAGTVAAVGAGVERWSVGDRVTVPFVCACGACEVCRAGDGQVCPNQTQPGFTHWGSMAGQVVLHAADVNLVALPDALSFVTAAALGCRFATAWRAVRQVGRVRAGEWVAVHGCGGVGLSAVQIAVAAGARVVAVDRSPGALALATAFGAERVLTVPAAGARGARSSPDGKVDLAALVARLRDATGDGPTLSLDAVGNPGVCEASIRSLAPRGRHVQVGLLPPELGRPAVPMELVVGRELEVLGSHGLAADGYPELLAEVAAGRLRPQDLVTREISLDEAAGALAAVGVEPGITVVTRF